MTISEIFRLAREHTSAIMDSLEEVDDPEVIAFENSYIHNLYELIGVTYPDYKTMAQEEYEGYKVELEEMERYAAWKRG